MPCPRSFLNRLPKCVLLVLLISSAALHSFPLYASCGDIIKKIFKRSTTPAQPDTAPLKLLERVRVGIAAIHRYTIEDHQVPHKVIQAHVPLEVPGLETKLLDSNTKPFDQPWPRLFLMGDAHTTRPFMYVDLRPGSELNRMIDRLLSEIPQEIREDPEKAIRYIQQNLSHLKNLHPPHYVAEPQPKLSARWGQFFDKAGVLNPFEAPVATDMAFPAVPLEIYLQGNFTMCIQDALISSLLLERLAIPHRVVHGTVLIDGGLRTNGHTWIKLPDGRVFDPTWNILEKPEQFHPDHPDWFYMGGFYRFETESYPYLAVDEAL